QYRNRPPEPLPHRPSADFAAPSHSARSGQGTSKDRKSNKNCRGDARYLRLMQMSDACSSIASPFQHFTPTETLYANNHEEQSTATPSLLAFLDEHALQTALRHELVCHS